ncbi:hypothetical protein VB618_18145 [Microvirga sp. CF3062]|uniref:hypothetical protein n=1 Tax=Microvirga sp. CF3062 TaxID=3110182 RepID=UPI002E78E281|nr:hypothetical protein [Microvirga sp. CF3062]MEE1658126.1 hypothetical protein [Microvirga sp. CF3062]
MRTLGASVQTRVRLRGVLKTLVVLSVLGGAGLAGTAEAAPASHGVAAKPAKEVVTSISARDVETTSSVQPTTGSDAHCDISRKRMFVEGEGWIVRRVTTCY